MALVSVRIPVTFDAAEKHPISWVSPFGEWSLNSNKREKTKLMSFCAEEEQSVTYIQKCTNGCYSFCFMKSLLSQPWSKLLFAISSFSVSRWYKPCTVHVIPVQCEKWCQLGLILDRAPSFNPNFFFDFCRLQHVRTLSFISKSDKLTWPVRSCLIHTTCQKINNNCEFGR